MLDLYSGVGSISLFCAGHADHVLGVEIVEEAVAAAESNRVRNNISNAEFVCADAGPFIREYAGSFDTLVLDPPRAGLHPKMVAHILAAAPQRIVYMSCNPGQFARELEFFAGYDLVSFKAFDMFPQTPHLESLAVFERSTSA